MALGGGIFTTQNKKLPGAYINFVSAQSANATISDRGVCAVPMALNWGPDSAVFTLTADDFISRSQKILGYDYGDDHNYPFRELFKNAQTVHVYRLNNDTTKAENEYARAKYGGIRGNDIKLVITSNVDNPLKFDVKTYVDNVEMDEQKGFSNTSELSSNDFVEFKAGVPLQLTAGMPLEGGDNGKGSKASNKYAEAKAAGDDGNNLAISVTEGVPMVVSEAIKATCKYGEAVQAGTAGNGLSIVIEQGDPYEQTPAVAASCKYGTAKQAGASGNNLQIVITEGVPLQTQAAVKATCKYADAKIAGADSNKYSVIVEGSSGAWTIKINDGSTDVFTHSSYAPASDIIQPSDLTNEYLDFKSVALTAETVQLAGGADAVTVPTYNVTINQNGTPVDNTTNVQNASQLPENDYVTYNTEQALSVETVQFSGGADAIMLNTYDVSTKQGDIAVDIQEGIKNKSELVDNAYVSFYKNVDLSVEAVQLTGGADLVTEPRYIVVTKLDGSAQDTQSNIASAVDLVDNQWVTFKKDVELELGEFPLSGGGENITVGSWQQAFNVFEGYSFNTLGVPTNDDSIKALAAEYTKRMRDNVGIKFQTVLFNYDADDKGVINLVNGLEENSEDPSLVYWVTGAQCGCRVYESLTNRNYDGELAPDVNRTQSQLESCIDNGQFVLHRVGDDVRVLTDINSKVTVTLEEGEDFKSNQTIRVLDQIGNDIAAIFNDQFLGKVPNDNAGRVSLWNEIVKHHQELLRLRAIEDFESDDVTISEGEDRKSVVVNDVITPVNALERLYMQVSVS